MGSCGVYHCNAERKRMSWSPRSGRNSIESGDQCSGSCQDSSSGAMARVIGIQLHDNGDNIITSGTCYCSGHGFTPCL